MAASSEEDIYSDHDDNTDSDEAEAFDSPDEAFATACAHSKDGRKEDAVICFGFALQLAEQRHGPAAAASARYYYHYGDALLAGEDKSADDLLDVAAAGGSDDERGEGNQARLKLKRREAVDIAISWSHSELVWCCSRMILQRWRRPVAIHRGGASGHRMMSSWPGRCSSLPGYVMCVCSRQRTTDCPG